ncbi:MAG TPA: SRPBCC family protein [Sunxiuqinia sp.]|nr:SRPBCC family protein [Sunxiuqinia sp.]
MKIEINKNAPAYNETQLLIHSPAEQVYKILSSINDWPKWQSSVSKVQLKGWIIPETKFVWKAGGLRIKSKIHTAVPPTELGWTGKILWIKAIHNWELIPEGRSTHVIVRESLEGFLAGLLNKTLIEGMDRNLYELKLEAEKRE